MAGVTQRTILSVNPALVVWPGESITFGFANHTGILTEAQPLSVPALRVLRAFNDAKPVYEVFRTPSSATLATLERAVDGGLLVVGSPDPNVSPLDSPNVFDGFHVADHWSPVERSSLAPHITRRVRLVNKSVFVLDGLLSPSRQRATYRWLLQLPYRLHDVDTMESAAFRHWISLFSPIDEYVGNVPLMQFITGVCKSMFRSKSLVPSRAHAYCVPYGDVQFAHTDFGSEKGVTGLYFANTEWKEEWGSEMLFFGGSGEPEVAIAPKPGRVVVFRGDIKHRAGAPSRQCTVARYTLVVRLVARTDEVQG